MTRACAVLLAITFAWSAQAKVLYRSDFQNLPNGTTQVPSWDLAGADYRVQDGWLTVKSDRSNPVATLQTTTTGDFTFRATIRGATRCHWSALQYGPVRLEINNQFVRVALMQQGQAEPLAAEGGYERFAANSQSFELRFVRQGNRLFGFLDARKAVEVELPGPIPADARFSLLGGWGTNVAWREISLTDEADLAEWPREKLPEPTGRKFIEVLKVRSLRDQSPDDCLYTDGQDAGFRATVRRREPGPVLLRFRVLDVNLRQVAEMATALDPAEGPIWNLETSTTARGRGCFKVALYAGPDEGHLGWVEDLGSFTVVAPELQTRPRLANSYFGSHMDGINLEWHLQQARKIGVQWARCHDMMQWTWWDRIQPNGPDEWKWGDAAQALVDRLGFQTSGEFLWVPKWAQNPAAPAGVNPATYPPADLSSFAKYVYETVAHYKGSVHVWEVWNEPHYSGFFSGTPEQYAQMLQVAYREAKRADPTCLVMGGGGVNMLAMGWIEKMLQAAGGQSMDIFSIHYLDPDRAKTDMDWLRAQLKSVGFTGPIWNTEESVLSSSFFDQCRVDVAEPEARYHYRNACCELVRKYMENLSNGVSRVFTYELADPWRFRTFDKPRVEQESPLTGSLWDEGQMLKPVGAAYAALALAIDGKPFVRRVESGPFRAFLFGDDESATAVQYALYPTYQECREWRIAALTGLKVTDMMGNELDLPVKDKRISVPLSRFPIYLQYRGRYARYALSAYYNGLPK